MTEDKKPQVHESWLEQIGDEFEKPYFKELKAFLTEEKKTQLIYPPGSRIFAALNTLPFSDVRVVILGQDPYHGIGQANGLCFSVSDGIPQPPSL